MELTILSDGLTSEELSDELLTQNHFLILNFKQLYHITPTVYISKSMTDKDADVFEC